MTRPAVASAALCFALAAWPSAATAQTAASPTPATHETAPADDGASNEPEVRWYGWKTLVTDAVSAVVGGTGILLFGAGAGGLGLALAVPGLAGFWLGAPIIHLRHHNPWAALGSGLARTTAAALLTGGLFSDPTCSGGPCGSGVGQKLILVGALVGVGAIVVDPFVANERLEPPPLTIVPWAAPRAGAGGLQLSGQW